MAAAPRTPAIVAIERLAKLAMAGTPVPRMILTMEGIVAVWRGEAISPRDVQERLDVLRDDVSAPLLHLRRGSLDLVQTVSLDRYCLIGAQSGIGLAGHLAVAGHRLTIAA